MKAKYYLLAGLGALMLGACGNDDDPGNPDNGLNIEGKAVMSLNLKFAGNEGVRAAEHQGFDDGTPDESEVKSVTVFYFGTDGSYKDKGTATAFTPGTGDKPNVTKTITASVPAEAVKELQTSGTAKIIVVLNTPTDFASKSFNNFEEFNAALTATDNAGFMMTSVNYWDKGKENKFNTITKENIAEEGGNPTPVEVYVERVCGKVTLTNGVTTTPDDVAVLEVKKWGLNVRNKTVFPVKELINNKFNFTTYTIADWPGADDWTHDDAVSKKRSYWAVDPNYDGTGNYAENPNNDTYPFHLLKFSELNQELGDDKPLYCLENTFSYEQQDRDESTTAVVYAQYVPNFNQGNGDDLTSADNKTWVMQNNEFYSMNVFLNNFLITNKLYTKSTVDGGNKYAPATYANINFTYTPIKENGVTIGGKDYKVAIKDGVTLYQKTGTGEEDKDYTEYANANDELSTAFTAYIANASIYVDGYCYYEIPIRHFTDQEVPLAANESDYNKQDQLGRYGVVRNHSYKLNITKITKPGKPIEGEDIIIPDPGTDDPKKDVYMTVEVKILSWAVRTQKVEL